MHVLTVDRQPARVVLTVESDADVGGCPGCGVVAVGHGRRRRIVADAPCFGSPVQLVWRARLWRCREPACPVGVFTERHDLVPPRAKVTSRAACWATDALTFDDTTVSALARHLGVDWHTCWDAIEVEATRRLADPARLDGVQVLGVDEHVWKPSRVGDKDRAVTGMVDLTRDVHGQLHARLLDVVPGRTGTAYAGWLKRQPDTFTAGISHASLDPFRGYANAIRDELPDAVAVLDAFHVVKLGTQVVDEVRRRVQQEVLGRRGHKDDPLYKIRGLLRRGREHLSDAQVVKLNTCLIAGDPGWEVTLAWHAYQQLRSMYQASTPLEGKAIAEQVIDSFRQCPIPEVARLGRTLKMWRGHVLARFESHRISNGGTEAVNLLIEKTRRLAHGFRTFQHYRLRILLAASGTRPYRRGTAHA
jgi:transposase